jgi:8-oxo-dGTP pyrophosphatase MutT (NUDIX family)
MTDVAALPSAAVLLVRDGPADGRSEPVGLEVLMVRRGAGAAAFGGAWVFPGGLVEPADYDRAPDPDLSPAAALDELTRRGGSPPASPDEALALWRAAARELAEEAGVRLPFLRALTYFSHWITPRGLPRRFDTRFFVAAMPPDQEAVHCGVETDGCCWVEPHRALLEYHEGRFPLVLPTRMHLQRIAPFRSVEALLAEAARKPIATVLPDAPRPTVDADPRW